MNEALQKAYIKVLVDELQPAMGCTEPIAIAYAAALAKRTLGDFPQSVEIEASGSIIKNVKSVVVPNTGGLRGIEAAAAAGIVAGDADRQLEVISSVTEAEKAEIGRVAKLPIYTVRPCTGPLLFDLLIVLRAGEHTARVRISEQHTNVVLLEKDGNAVIFKPISCQSSLGEIPPEKQALNIRDIVTFAQEVDLDEVRPVLQRQIDYNMAIAEEGLRGNYGGNVGRVLLQDFGTSVRVRACAKAAAGSDARMSGCELPVVINSGSGNQGITVSVPVVEYARELGADDDKLMRALIISNLVAIHQKSGIGVLSAYCGAVSAGAAAGAGIAYLLGGGEYEIEHTIVNCLAITSGIVCDGAKPSCAGKIAISLNAALLAYRMICNAQQFRGGDGIVKKGVEATIDAVGRLGRDGMRDTNREILDIMTQP